MREIKLMAIYRDELCPVWHINFETKVAGIRCKSSATIYMDGTQPKINKMVRLSDVELIQYIGIKDIHQKKVFQGHIVKVKRVIYINCSREEIEETIEYTGEVTWHQFGWHIAEKIEGGIRYHSLWLWNIKDDETDPDTHSMEILGNRWDNPEMGVVDLEK